MVMDTPESRQSCKGHTGSSETSRLVCAEGLISASGKVQLHGKRGERVLQVPSPTASIQLPMTPQPPGHINRVLV